MSRPLVVAFGPWLPDGADVAFGVPFQYSPTTIPLADCSNVYYAQGAYRSLPSFAAVAGGALPSRVLGAVTALDASGNPYIYAGTGSDINRFSASTWTQVSKSGGAYAGSQHWSFVEFAGCVLATNGINALQDATVGSGNFADVTAAPIGNVLGAIGQFVFVGDIVTGLVSDSNIPYRVYWPAIGDPTSWPTPLTDAATAAQSGFEDLTQDFGAVMFIGGGPQMGVILQRHGITRASYQGGDTVFSFLAFERKRGLIARGAAVQVGAVTHFIADDGFHMTDGSQTVATGTAQSAALDKWFWNNVNQDALSTISAGYASDKQCVVYAIPTGTNALPDTLLLLNPQSGQWTKATMSVERLWSDNDGTRHRVGIFNQSHLFGLFTGTPARGYCETYDAGFVDGLSRSVSEATPNVVCTDEPLVRIGVKDAIDDDTSYTGDAARDSFTRRCTFDPPPEGKFLRARLSSSAASAMHGVTVYLEQGGAA